MNRLAQETSPYLLQHANNPVHWNAWGPDALNRARTEDKLLLVSIGYSACHWCHVMEHESFENEQIASLMNEHFVCIKVDREERPDVDAIYMEAVQAMGIQGGWPLNVFLLPDARPFYGGTYFPPQRWVKVLADVANAYVEYRDQLESSAASFAGDLQLDESGKYGLNSITNYELRITNYELGTIFSTLAASFDPERGGLARAPKFPMPSVWRFALRYLAGSPDEEALRVVRLTLDRMAAGGLYDQVGGGFARYSTDAEWFLPHFEKMLYDNGQLLSLYAEVYTLTQDPAYARIIRQTVTWLRREMVSEEGGFYSALDADSEGEEGKFYTWTKAELDALLGSRSDAFCQTFGVTEGGNFREEATGHTTGQNILFLGESWNENHLKFKEELEKLLLTREKRVRPGLDDKILTSWNGLMLRGLVDAYRALGDEEFLQLARQNASFLLEKVTRKNNALWHSYKNTVAKIDGFLDDYATLCDAFTQLYQVTFDERYLRQAEQWADYVLTNFWDEPDGLFFYTDAAAEPLIARKKELFDNVIPASNSLMANALYELSLLLDRSDFGEKAAALMSKVWPLVQKEPAFLTNWATLATRYAQPTAEVVIVGPECHARRRELEAHFYPNKIVAGAERSGALPLLEGRAASGVETLIYICFNKTCQLPVRTVDEAMAQINR
ncbi:MAG: thioredoxin domain-containing protein [Cytophagaceae bacterium]|nr:thioredoxin domain-containing protein [Cytophagaceae bacterium]